MDGWMIQKYILIQRRATDHSLRGTVPQPYKLLTCFVVALIHPYAWCIKHFTVLSVRQVWVFPCVILTAPFPLSRWAWALCSRCMMVSSTPTLSWYATCRRSRACIIIGTPQSSYSWGPKAKVQQLWNGETKLPLKFMHLLGFYNYCETDTTILILEDFIMKTISSLYSILIKCLVIVVCLSRYSMPEVIQFTGMWLLWNWEMNDVTPCDNC